MTQEGRQIQFLGYSGNPQALSDSMAGEMAYTFSNWGPKGAEWLDGGRCQSACGDDSVYEVSNIKFVTGGASPTPPPSPGNYTYGDACASKSDGLCDGSCDCFWSWPSASTWQDPDAACRCKVSASNSPQSNNLTQSDMHYADLLQKLHEAEISFEDIEEIYHRGQGQLNFQEMAHFVRHCSETVQTEDCINAVNWLKAAQY